MNKSILSIVLFCFITTGLVSQEDTDIVKIGNTVPSFTITSDNGKELKSNTLKGKVTMIVFFATWCPPCQVELAAIEEKLWPVYKDNNSFSLLVIGREHSDAELAEYNDNKNFSFPLYPDKNRAIYNKFAKSLIPRVYLIGKDGKIKTIVVGHTDEGFTKLMEQIEKALK